MFQPLAVGARVLLAALVLPIFAAPLAAQGGGGGRTESRRPEVHSVKFEGVRGVSVEELRLSVATEASGCVNALLRYTVCPFTHASGVYTRHHLDSDELARDVLRIRVFYWREGYRAAKVDTTVATRPDGMVDVAFLIDEGAPTIVDTVTVAGVDSLLNPGQVHRLLKLRSGQPLSMPALDSSVMALRDALWDQGFADAIIDTSVVLDSAASTAAVHLDIHPRWLARVGVIRVAGLEELDTRTVRNSLVLHQGDIFRRSEMLRSQRKLYESSLFQRAGIEAEGDSAVKQLLVTVKEGDMQTVRLAAGFSTVDYVQVDGRYTNYNFFGRARRLQLQVTLGNLLASALEDEFIFTKLRVSDDFSGDRSPFLRPNWQTSLELSQPWFGGARNTLAASIFAHRRSTPGVVIDHGQGLNTSFTRNVAPQIDASANYRFEVSRVEAGGVYFCVNFGICDPATIDAISRTQRLSPVALIATANRADDPLEPRHGYTGSLTLEHASQFTASDFRYTRGLVDVAAFRPFAKGVVAAHVKVGWAQAHSSESLSIPGFGDVAVLHPRKRFYSGGSRSVRGYGENQLGPRVLTIAPDRLEEIGCAPPFDMCANLNAIDSTGHKLLADEDFTARPIGGAALAEASLEYRFPVWGPLLAAAFVDGAVLTAGDNGLFSLSDNFMAVTPGIGVRYRSPVGPIRVDIAYRPRIRGGGGSYGEALPVLTQVTENGQRRIVRVGGGLRVDDRPLRVYDSDKTFFSRIALHLSIGEAF